MSVAFSSWKSLARHWGGSARSPHGVVLALPAEASRRHALFYPSLVLLAFLGGGAATWWHLRPAPLHHFAVDNGIVTAFDSQGQSTWAFRSGTNAMAGPGTYFAKVVQTDLDADGSDELLVTRELPNSNHVLYCFNARGDTLWTRNLGRTVQTVAGTMEPPFHARGFAVLRGFPDEIPRIAVIAFHHMWYPSQLLLLDRDGNILGEYWHSGHITAMTLFDIDRDGHPELVVGGINQASRSAEVAVLDPFQLTGASTEENPAFQFLNMPTGVERARIVLTPSPLSRLTAAYNQPVALLPKRDSLLLDVNESTGIGTPGNSLTYEFSRELRVLAVSPSDQFVLSQAALVRSGKLPRVLTAASLAGELPIRWVKRWAPLPH